MRKKILIVDDTEDILANLQEYLMMEGYETTTAKNGTEALTMAKLNTPDLIITDLLMHGMTGFELIKQLKKRKVFCKIPVIVFSARPMDENLCEKDIGADRFVLKPSSPEDLVKQVKELLKP